MSHAYRMRILFIYVCIVFFATLSNSFAGEKSQSNSSGLIFEVRSGILAHDVNNLWSHSRKESGADINGEIILNLINGEVFNGIIRPHIGLSVNTSGETSKFYSGVKWERELKNNFIADLGIGLAVHNGELNFNQQDKKALGSRILFHVPVEIGCKINNSYRIFLFFDHVSNAGLSDPNEGMDTLGLRIGYRF